MDGPTDGRTDGRMDTTSYRDATAHLKRKKIGRRNVVRRSQRCRTSSKVGIERVSLEKQLSVEGVGLTWDGVGWGKGEVKRGRGDVGCGGMG